MTTNQVETKLVAAMALLNSVEQFQGVMTSMFEDGTYSLARGCVLWVFTHMMMDMHRDVAEALALAYTNFIQEHFDPMDVPALTL